MSENRLGERIFKEYTVKGDLGEGAFGRVYLVENAVGLPFALKVLHKGVEMEQRGVQSVRRIRSHRLVAILDYGQTARGEFCVLMEYVPVNLEAWIAENSQGEDQACRLFIELLKGLEVLEANSFIHRDLKPANLFIQEDLVKIGDFGSVKYTSGQSSRMSTDAPRTLCYSAPERFKKSFGLSVDRWSAAVVLCEMLTGRLPFAGDDQTQIYGAILGEEPDLSGIPARYLDFLAKSFEKKVSSRYESAREMREVFESLLREKGGANRPRSGDVWREPETGMDLLWVPGGSFWMGQTEEEKQVLIKDYGEEEYKKYFIRELPRHQVSVDGLWLGRTEVTVGQFRRFIEATGYVTDAEREGFSYNWTGKEWEKKEGLSWGRAGIEQDEGHPVAHVSWNDAKAMADWLTKLGKGGFRLPTEAEWEYACRAGATTPFYFGETISTDQANYDGNYVYGKGKKGEYRGRTTPVGSFPANRFGLYDMHGNVWEWCEDIYSGDAYEHHAPSNPIYTSGGPYRVLRGGSWFHLPSYVRCAYRNDATPELRRVYIGFRLARTV